MKSWHCSWKTKMRTDSLRLIGLMRRAGKLETGEEGCRAAARAGKAVLILVAEDASANAKDRAARFAQTSGAAILMTDASKAELAGAAGVSGGAMMAVCDVGFAAALLKKLEEESPGTAADLLPVIKNRREDPQKKRRKQKELKK